MFYAFILCSGLSSYPEIVSDGLFLQQCVIFSLLMNVIEKINAFYLCYTQLTTNVNPISSLYFNEAACYVRMLTFYCVILMFNH